MAMFAASFLKVYQDETWLLLFLRIIFFLLMRKHLPLENRNLFLAVEVEIPL